MPRQRPFPWSRATLCLACLLAVGALPTRGLEAAPDAPAYGQRLTPEATADANPNDDVDQQPAVLVQWSSSGPTRGNPGWIVEHLGRDGAGHRVERRGIRYPSGAWATRETTVRSELPGKPLLSDVKRGWGPSGTRTFLFRQTNVLNAAGAQIGGERSTLNYSQGRLTRETKEHWDPAFGGWLETTVRTTTYYGDGDMKRRVTEQPALNRKTEEDWGPRGARGREKTAHLVAGHPKPPAPRP